MKARVQKTTYTKSGDYKAKWWIVDASGKVLGRLAAEVAKIVRGKNNVMFYPSVDAGDFVVVINADKIRVTGKKAEQKKYYRHSGYPGGLKETNFEAFLSKQPERLVEQAISGMLPKNRLGRQLFNKIKVYAKDKHPHEAQQPQQVDWV